MQRYLNQFWALMKKRSYFLRRKFYWFIPAIAVSICLLLLAIWLALSDSDSYYDGGPTMHYSLQLYGKPKVYYGGSNSSDPLISNLRKYYSEAVITENGEPLYSGNISDGIIKEGVINIVFYKRHMVTAVEFNSTSNKKKVAVNAMYSPGTLHGLPISINLAMNAVAKAMLGTNFSITTSNTPLKPLHSESTPSELSVINVMSLWSILIPISMFFFMSNFIIFPSTEVSTNFIQIQTFAGIKIYFYWITNVIFDAIFAVPLMTILFSVLCLFNWLYFNTNAFGVADVGAMVVIYGVYIVVALPFAYLFSFRKTISGGVSLSLMLGIICGIVPSLIIIAMEFSDQDYYIKIANCLKPVLIISSPPFAISYLTAKFSKKYVENFNWVYMDPNKRNHICNTDPNPCCDGETTTACYKYRNYYISETLGNQNDLLLMMVTFFIYFSILIFLSTEIYQKIMHFLKYPISSLKMWKNLMRCHKGDFGGYIGSDTTLEVRNLTKTFGTKTIVENLQFNLKKNECFGLLGVNGAGKSTTFRILTKNLFFDNGDIIINQEEKEMSPITINQPEYCKKIGYCPQENCLNYFLSGRELIKSLALIKGYSKGVAEKVTKDLLSFSDLNEYADTPCSEYSGGNKRKLCTSMAFLGSPEVICLDEPTSGVDPASRRKFWNILSFFKRMENTSFLLCSHSMEECENLCDNIAIMKGGKIEDQGSLLHLKNKYQNGFKITVILKQGINNSEKITQYISKNINGRLVEEYANTLTYEVIKNTTQLSIIFYVLEGMKQTNTKEIEDYAVNQISLEDIFLTVAEMNQPDLFNKM